MCRSIAIYCAARSFPSLTPTQKSIGQAALITTLAIGALALAIHFNLDFQRVWEEKVVPLLADPRVRITFALITGLTGIVCVSFLIHRCSLLSQKQVNELYREAKRHFQGAFDFPDMSAFNRLKAEATAGNIHAQRRLGPMYRFAEGVEKDLTKALKWYEKAAAAGDQESQVALALMYERGVKEGIPRDLTKAVYWYEKAASQRGRHTHEAQYNLARLYQGHSGEEMMDHKKAVEWYKKVAAQQGSFTVEAEFELALMYEGGHGVPADGKEAARWYERVAGHAGSSFQATAQWNLGRLYRDGGSGVERDSTKAMEWFTKAAHGGFAYAQYSLGILLIDTGHGFLARGWLERAAAQGIVAAREALAKM